MPSPSELPGVRVRPTRPGALRHLVTVECGGSCFEALVLRGLGASTKRDRVVLNRVDQVAHFSTATQAVAVRYRRAVIDQLRVWGIGATAGLKKLDRLHRTKSLLEEFPLTTVANRYGPVPVLVLGRAANFQICYYPDVGAIPLRAERAAEAELEYLRSLEDELAHLLTAYYEQIAYYLTAILFGSAGKNEGAYCLRIRQILKGSIRGKLSAIERGCESDTPEIRVLAREIREKFGPQIREGRAVDAYVHLLVNHVYRLRSIEDRVEEYLQRLLGLADDGALVGHENRIGLMKTCAENIELPQDEFRADLLAMRSTLPWWLSTFARASVFISEVYRALNGRPVFLTRLFLTYHFQVRDSMAFAQRLRDEVASRLPHVEVIEGRDLGRDLRWSLLARIWFANGQMLFLPTSWIRPDGREKRHRLAGNWVILELLYGLLLRKTLTTVVAEPENADLVEQFIHQVREYVAAEHEVPATDWEDFVSAARCDLGRVLEDTRRLGFEGDESPGLDFWFQVERDVVNPAITSLLRTTLLSWCYFFEAETWSLAQALLCASDWNEQAEVTVAQLTAHVHRLAIHGDARFRWAVDHPRLEDDVRRRLRDLRRFRFRVGSTALSPVNQVRRAGRVRITLDLRVIYEALCHEAGAVPTDGRLVTLRSELLQRSCD